MNRKLVVTWIVAFVVWMGGSFVVHGVLLHDDYARLPNLFRPEADSQRYMPFMLLAHIIMSGAFAWIYSFGVGSTHWVGQGLRFGIAGALLTAVPTYLIYYVVQPMPPATVAKQIIFGSIVVIVVGLVVAAMYRPPAPIVRASSA